MDGQTKVLVSHAGLKGVFKDPNDEVYYFTKNRTLNDRQSFFVTASLSRFFIVPDKVRADLSSRKDLIISDELKQYPKYRGVWDICPSCHSNGMCGSVLLKDSNVAIGHCINNEEYNFCIISEEDFLEVVQVLTVEEDEDEHEH